MEIEFDGVVHEFPDDFSDDDIAAALSPPAANAAPAAPLSPRQEWKDVLARGSKLDGLLTGLRDPIDAAAQLLPRGLEKVTSLGGLAPNPASEFFGREAQRVDGMVKGNEAEYQAGRETVGRDGFDLARGGGNIASLAIPGAVVQRGVTAAAKANGARGLLANAAGASASGATMGAAAPVLDGDFADQKADQVLLGAALGPVLDGAGRAVGSLIKPAKRKAQGLLMREGVTLTPGQYYGGALKSIEDKAMSLPIIGGAIQSARKKGEAELNRAVADRALSPIGQKMKKDVAPGHDMQKHVRKTIGENYDRVLQSVTFAPDQQFITELNTIRQMAQQLPKDQVRQFNKVVQDNFFGKATQYGRMNGDSFKASESELKRLAKGYRGSASFNERQLGDALASVLESMRGTLSRQNPGAAAELAASNKAWANYVPMRRAGSSVAADDGAFTPAQLHNAVKVGDGSVGKRAFSEGDALMQDLSGAAKGVMQSKYPDSGTPGRLMMAGLLGSGFAAPAIPLAGAAGLSAGALPYLLRGTTQGALRVGDKAAKRASKLARKGGKYGVPLLLPPAIEARE